MHKTQRHLHNKPTHLHEHAEKGHSYVPNLDLRLTPSKITLRVGPKDPLRQKWGTALKAFRTTK